jgi:hypothetical protein
MNELKIDPTYYKIKNKDDPPVTLSNPAYMNCSIGTMPKPIGFWVMPGSNVWVTKFAVYNKRPRWLTRFMMKYVFEWKWEDA